MFASKPKDTFAEIISEQDADRVLTDRLSVVFKHSPTCVISRMAYSEVERFHAQRPETPIHLVSVRRNRDISRYIAYRTGVHHESPQIVVLRNGKVIASASHEQITADFLGDLLDQA